MDLGTVLVRMRLRDGQLELHLQASREETAALLRRDGELLTGLLRGAGYQADGATIGQGGQEPFGPTGAGSGLPSGDGQSPPQGRPPSSEPERRPASARAAESQDTREWTNETNPADPGRHDVYL
jgi:chemotaxis protein MotD